PGGVQSFQSVLGLLVPRLSFASLSVPDIPHIAGYFGTKTRYEEVKPHLLRDPLSADPSVLRPPPAEHCSPVHLTAVIRHGSRYPTLKNIRRIRKLSELVRTEASRASGGSESWLQEIRNRWEAWYTEDMDGQLVMKGRDDLRQLASRLASVFPSLLSEENVRKRRVRFLTSSKHRCVSSVEAFQEGLQRESLGLTSDLCVWADAEPEYSHEVDDELMRFFDRCRGYVDGVENNRTALLEVEKFKHGEEMEGVRRRMADRLGLPHHRLTPGLLSFPNSVPKQRSQTAFPNISLWRLAGRRFRTSLIVPYAANLLFVLYDCQRGPRLQLLVNESPVRFPGLEAEDAPLYRDVRATYRHLLDGCDFHRECEGRAVGRAPNTEL
uniref:Multiple inositol-polyphosphate phosphatase 1b n=1 Tax=Neolamprologus brichardi TaxID=32507 RepID=A0A3Q4G4Q9_NEOBR